MSLILEALKKSEQQRRLGETPTLGSPALASRRRRSVLPVLVALVAIAIGVGWWLLRTPGASMSGTPLAQNEVAPKSATAPVASGQSAPPPIRHADQPASKPANGAAADARLHAVAPANPAATGKHGPAVDVRTAPPRATLPASDRPGSVAQLPPALPGVAGPNPAPARSTPKKNAAASVPAVPAAAKPDRISAPNAGDAVATTPARQATQAQTRPAPARPALPSVWELSYATRKDLPDLTPTMHVYADDPHQRFVVVKGDRHVEGDDLGDGVTLREIRPDGMVLEFKGQRFVYPRDGR
jgi:general secretion pathway protein B